MAATIGRIYIFGGNAGEGASEAARSMVQHE
jgi:hypothetical protein